jgi:UPF0755 protein
MRKILVFLFLLVLIAGGFLAFTLFRPAVKSGDNPAMYFYIKTGEGMQDVKASLINSHFISGQGFDLTRKMLRFNRVRPGRYQLKKGMSLYALVKMLRNGKQTAVKMVISKERTPESFAGKFGLGKRFDSETDSLAMISFLRNSDTLSHYGVDTNTVMAIVMPFTYELPWNSSPTKIFRQFYAAYKKFWNIDRKIKADSLHLTPLEVSTLASIVEEETNRKEDRYNIASTYIIRLRTGMKLQADPTIKFSLKDFKLGRITGKHLTTVSPYNTYLNAGLPPGPICTPSVESLEAVLNAPSTDYLYFVASDRFDGSSVFTSNFGDHQKYAKLYQQELTRRSDSVKKARANSN